MFCQDLLRVQVARWFVMLLIGILTALVASCIDICVRELTKVKFSRINYCIHLTFNSSGERIELVLAVSVE